MKLIAFLMPLLLTSFIIPSTVLNKSAAQYDQPVVLWVGTYTAEQVPQQGELYYSFIVKPDNTLITESKGNDGKTYYSSGKWMIQDSLFIYELMTLHNGIRQRGILKLVDCNTMSDGSWKDINNIPNLNGTFPKMTRIPSVQCNEPCNTITKL